MIPKPLDASVAAQIINSLSHWHVHAPTAPDVLAAIDIHRRTGASFWDAMILPSAQPDAYHPPHSGAAQFGT